MFTYERKHEKLATVQVFIGRVLKSLLLSCALIGVALSIGVLGYHWIAGFDWIDALLEGSMILGGMGPVNPLKTNAAKIFASIYALFSGVIFIGVMGMILAPLIHRTLHKFHLEKKNE